MKKPPSDPSEPFMNRRMLRPLFLGALSLFLAVTVTYLFTYYTSLQTLGVDAATVYARTVAFATWMFGHIFLALNFRSENTPLLKQGLLSNKVMLLWALLAFVVLVAGTFLLQSPLQITAIKLTDWVLATRCGFYCDFLDGTQKIPNRKNLRPPKSQILLG